MFCAQTDGQGYVQVLAAQPADISTCSMVIVSPSEIGVSPFALSMSDAATIGQAIVLVWGIGFAARAVIRALGSDSEVSANE